MERLGKHGPPRRRRLRTILRSERRSRESKQRVAPSGSRTIVKLATSYYGALALGVITGPLSARRLGPVGQGQVEAIVLLVTFVSLLFTMGINSAVSHAMANEGEPTELLLGAIFRYSLWLFLPSAALPLLLLISPWNNLPRAAALVALFTLLIMPTRVFGASLEGLLLGRGDLRALATLRAFAAILTAIAIVILFVTRQLGVATDLATTALVGVITLILGLRLVAVRPRSGGSLKKLLRFGVKGVAAHFSSFANARLDQLIVLPVLGVAALGQYSVAVVISLVPLSLAQAIGAHTFTRVGDSGDFDPSTAARLLRKSTIVSVTICAAIGASAPIIIPLAYGSAFRPSIFPLLLLLPGTVCLSLNEVTFSSLIYLGQPGLLSLGEVAGLLTTLIGLFIALPAYGIAGAAVVSSLAYGVRLGINLILLRQHGVRGLIPRLADAGELRHAVRSLVHRS